MYPGHWAEVKPGTLAVVNTVTDESLTWRAINEQSNQVAQLLADRGLGIGDHVSLLMENRLEYFVIAWGVLRSGMYLTCINRYLTVDEAAYIVNDSGSKALFASDALDTTENLLEHIPECSHRFSVGNAPPGYNGFSSSIADMPTSPIADEMMGDTMLYSSGTTGRPKGIKRALSGLPITEGIPGVARARNAALSLACAC